MTLSHSKLKALLNRKQATRLELSDRDGLSARVSEYGHIVFQYRYRFLTKSKRMTIGRFPDITLTQARDKIPELRLYLANGQDPSIETKRKLKKEQVMLKDCIDLFLERHVKKLRLKTQKLYRYSLYRHALEAFTQPVEDIYIHEWFEYFDFLEDTVSPICAQDILVRLKTCLRFCIKRGLISNSVMLTIAPKDVGKSSKIGDRVVNPNEIKLIWKTLDASRCYPTTINVIKLCSLTGARNAEVRHLQIKDINFIDSTWTIPAEKSKTGVKFTRALGPKALEILQWQIQTFGEVSDYIFPSGSYKQHISSQTVNKLSRTIIKKTNMEPWKVHDFRRSISTILSQEEVDLHVTEKMLGHSLGGILAIYNKHDWINEQRKAYIMWEKLIIL
jgi:integrase